jgi:hypothetical protein
MLSETKHLCFLPDRSVEIDSRFFAPLRMTERWITRLEQLQRLRRWINDLAERLA